MNKDICICILKEEEAERALKIEIFGLSLSLTGLAPGCPVIITSGEDGLKVNVGNTREA